MSAEAYPRSRTDTLVGPGMRIEGRVAFHGVLRVYGEIDGDVACPDDPAGVLVVEPAGRVAGSVAAPNLVVKGRLLGEMRSAGSIEILSGGSAEGDASYRTLDVRRGGRLVGLMQPTAADGEPVRVIAGESPELTSDRLERGEALLPAVAATSPRRMIRRRHLAAAGLVVAVLALLWSRRTAVDEAAPAATPAVAFAPVAAPLAGKPEAPLPAIASAPTPAAAPETPPAPAPAPPRPAPDADRVLAVQGSNAAKASNLVYVVTRDAAVVYRKRRGDAGDGTRIEIERNRNLGLPVARNEVLRFAEGRAVEAFYQGRKLPPQWVEEGAWISFTPATGE